MITLRMRSAITASLIMAWVIVVSIVLKQIEFHQSLVSYFNYNEALHTTKCEEGVKTNDFTIRAYNICLSFTSANDSPSRHIVSYYQVRDIKTKPVYRKLAVSRCYVSEKLNSLM